MTDETPPADDLVERLRNMASAWKRWGADGIFRGALHSDIVNEAASEIARLRQKLEDADKNLWLMGEARDAQQVRADLAQSQRDALAKAAEPFETFAAQAVDEHGWTDDFGRERIFDWFGPEDFRALASARAQAMGE